MTAYFNQTTDDSATTDVTEGGDIAPNLLNSISGTVSNLRDDADEVIDGSWTVDLMKGDITGSDGTFAGRPRVMVIQRHLPWPDSR